jgi:hypothetical protein
VSLLRSPHFAFGAALTREAVSALDRALSDARYLGDLDRLSQLAAEWRSARREPVALPALDAAIAAALRLSPLREAAPATAQIERVLSFLQAYAVPDTDESRGRRARAAIIGTLEGLAAACQTYDDAPVEVNALAALVRRSIEEQTFATDDHVADADVLQFVDDQSPCYGAFDQPTIVGLIEGEWPDRPLRNIFYPSTLLRALGWPSEQDGGARRTRASLICSGRRAIG